MKQLFFITAIYSFLGTKSQPLYVEKISDAYFGTWQWVNGNDTFTVTLTKGKYYLKEFDKTIDFVYGWHNYIEKGKTIESRLEFANNMEKEKSTVTGLVKNNILKLTFYDISRDRFFNVNMELLDNKNEKAKWTSSLTEQIRVNKPPAAIADGQTIPSPIILEKIFD